MYFQNKFPTKISLQTYLNCVKKTKLRVRGFKGMFIYRHDVTTNRGRSVTILPTIINNCDTIIIFQVHCQH